MKRLFSLLILFFCVHFLQAQTKVIPLYEGKPPGSEQWNYTPDSARRDNILVEYNIIEPTLTFFPARGAVNTGTAVVIAPGGGYFVLATEHEGNDVARRLNEAGVNAFVLRYRVKQVANYPEDVQRAWSDPEALPELVKPVMKMAGQDGMQAVRYVREHATELGVNPDRIGFMGFSAGGGVTMSVALESSGVTQPDFIAPVYPYIPPYLGDLPVPDEKMPMFVIVSTDDPLDLAGPSASLYLQWVEAGQPAELHAYATGGHGFGALKKNVPADGWLDQLEAWMAESGLLWPENPTGWAATTTYKDRQQWLDKQAELMQTDWANLQRFTDDNKNVNPPARGEKRVVFMGNSITEGWIRSRPEFFEGKPWINRGISGQTTPQMLARFRQDVIDLEPEVVVILAGTNDIAGNTGPLSLEDTFGYLVSMTELARANGIRVILSSVLPAYDYPWSPGLEPNRKIPELNEMIREYTANHEGVMYLDYFSAMADKRNGLKAGLGSDGVHPNADGYAIMEPMVEQAIRDILNE